MIETCTECGEDFITEADLYGVQRRPDRTILACGKCFVGIIEPHRLIALKNRDREITQLKDVILDLSEALQELKGGLPVSCNIDREITTKTLSKHQYLIKSIQHRGEE